MGWVPLQLPGFPVSVWPCCAVPLTEGRTTLAGGCAVAVTTDVAAEVAVLEPAVFPPVTATRIVKPTSDEVSA